MWFCSTHRHLVTTLSTRVGRGSHTCHQLLCNFSNSSSLATGPRAGHRKVLCSMCFVIIRLHFSHREKPVVGRHPSGCHPSSCCKQCQMWLQKNSAVATWSRRSCFNLGVGRLEHRSQLQLGLEQLGDRISKSGEASLGTLLRSHGPGMLPPDLPTIIGVRPIQQPTTKKLGSECGLTVTRW